MTKQTKELILALILNEMVKWHDVQDSKEEKTENKRQARKMVMKLIQAHKELERLSVVI